jgi:hypothetical protein
MHAKWALLLLFVLFSCARTAHAFFDPPFITPLDPVEAQPITFSIRGGVCDAIADREGYPIYSQVGNAIHITYYGAHVLDSEQCIFGTGTGTFPVGAYPAGDYTLTLDLDYLDGFGRPANLPLGVINFTVAGAAPSSVAVSTLGGGGALLMAIFLFWVASIVLRRPDDVLLEGIDRALRSCGRGRYSRVL